MQCKNQAYLCNLHKFNIVGADSISARNFSKSINQKRGKIVFACRDYFAKNQPRVGDFCTICTKNAPKGFVPCGAFVVSIKMDICNFYLIVLVSITQISFSPRSFSSKSKP